MTEVAPMAADASIDPSTYAKLPAGTIFKWGAHDAEEAALKQLVDADAIGVTGKTSGFVEITRLVDTERKYMSDLPEGADKEFVFLDNPGDEDLTAFLAAADGLQTVKIRIEFPNKRWAEMIVALGGWSMQELDKSAPMRAVVTGKQNKITRGVTTGS